jgi:hypothetical protein
MVSDTEPNVIEALDIVRHRLTVLDRLMQRHKRQGRPKIAECTCGTILCVDLAIIEGRKR